MDNYVVYFQVAGKKMKQIVPAHNDYHAENLVRDFCATSFKVHQVSLEVPEPKKSPIEKPDFMKDIFGSFFK